MKKGTSILLAAGLSILLVSCASVAHYEAIDDSVSRGDFKDGLAKLQAVKETAYQPKDKVLYYLDEGMLAHYAGDWSTASKSLGEAERGIEEAVTKSVSKGVASYLVNDNTLEYPGEDYEDIYLNIFNAFNYYKGGSVEDALVEIRRIDNKIKFLSTKYGTEISGAQKAVMDKSSEIPYDPETATSKFSNSALAQYIGMLFYRAEGKYDDARINRDQIKLSFANQPNLYGFGLPKTLDGELDVPKGKARLNVISFSGLSPVKTENVMRIGMSGDHWMKIAVPVMQQRPTLVARTVVAIDNGPSFDLDLIEDMGAVANETFKQKAALIYLKTVLRSLVKTSSSMVMDEQSEKSSDANTALLLSVLSVGTQIYAEASEQADLRLSRYFPSKALVGGITLEPGVYSYSVKYLDAAGSLIKEARFENVEIGADKLNLTEAICIK